ncbi:MAG: NTP transferase domain-containing protein [Elusimicrobiota bacterium]|nr:NTP transferase domain-containing protein [Elusimicrobiota bacterium]
MSSSPHIKAFIQARTSSRRFPGKVLTPFRGRPLIDWVWDAAAKAVPRSAIVLATSTDASDDALAAHALSAGVTVFRGPLDDVFARFSLCLKAHPCDWFFRVCADSPLLDGGLLSWAASQAGPGVDLVTNVAPRSFPKGQSVELIRATAFAAVDAAALTPEQREHATLAFYQDGRWKVKNLDSGRPEWAKLSLTVDSPEDLRRLESEYPAGRPLPVWTPARSAA